MKKTWLILTLSLLLIFALSLPALATAHDGLCGCGRNFALVDSEDYMIFDCLGCGRNYTSCTCHTCWCGSDLTRTQDFVKKSLLEYGIYDLNVYLVPQKESRLLYEQESEGGSIQLRSAKKAMELYSRYYAGQYRLRSRSDALGQSLMEDGFVRDKDLFRNVERVMRSSREFEKAHDQQVFEGHEWVMGFLEDLEHWLDMESA